MRHAGLMLIRRTASCLRLARTTSPRKKVHTQYVRCQRASTTAAPPPAHATSQSAASALGSLTSELDKLSPCFDVPADSIGILKSPSEFYETLKAKITNAKRRIYLSTLYVGKSEYELVPISLFPYLACITNCHRSILSEMHSSGIPTCKSQS